MQKKLENEILESILTKTKIIKGNKNKSEMSMRIYKIVLLVFLIIVTLKRK